MGAPSAYRHETFAMATMHAKERAVARPLSRWLGAAVKVAPGIDTDAFGTFTGDISPAGHDARRRARQGASRHRSDRTGTGAWQRRKLRTASIRAIHPGRHRSSLLPRSKAASRDSRDANYRSNQLSKLRLHAGPGHHGLPDPREIPVSRCCRFAQSAGRSRQDRQGNNPRDQTCRSHRAGGFRVARRACSRRDRHAGSPQPDADGLNPGFGNPPRAASCDALSGMRRARIWSGGRLARIALRLVWRAYPTCHCGIASLRQMWI